MLSSSSNSQMLSDQLIQNRSRCNSHTNCSNLIELNSSSLDVGSLEKNSGAARANIGSTLWNYNNSTKEKLNSEKENSCKKKSNNQEINLASNQINENSTSSSNNLHPHVSNKTQSQYLNVIGITCSSNSCTSSISSSSASSSNSSTSSFTLSNIPININQEANTESNFTSSNLEESSFSNLNEQNESVHLSTDPEKKLMHQSINESSLNASTSLASSANNNGNSFVGTASSSPEPFRRSIFGSFRESSYKKQKENYLTEKKRITNDMLTIMRDESIIVLADWLKIRGSLKNWIKMYVILKPGIMLLFKSDKMKPGQWVGTIILNSCQLLERPSKKHGFCFKLFHPMEKSIWASKGPAGETYINVPYMLLPTFYLIFRAPSEKIGNIWMDALELTLKSSHLLKPPSMNYLNLSSNSNQLNSNLNESLKLSSTCSNLNGNATDLVSLRSTNKSTNNNNNQSLIAESTRIKHSSQNSTSSLQRSASTNQHTSSHNAVTGAATQSQKNMVNHGNEAIQPQTPVSILVNNENDIENKHFNEINDNTEDLALTDSDGVKNSSDDLCSLNSSNNQDENLEEFYDEYETSTFLKKKAKKGSIKNTNESNEEKNNINETHQTKYVASPNEEFGELGNKGQTEEVGEENKSLIFCLVKQVRPGMDLSKVVLPTFILEPRSFLEKLTDFYYHSDLLTESINNDDPFERMKSVVKFYLSGFYKKPKGLKKPYNPILGEVFRSYWFNPKTQSKTFYIAEQVSHHPPITSFYVTNRKEGFCIYGTILARSKFYGNSVSAIMEGHVKLILLNRGEEYIITMPYANCKGILIGKLTMELGGKINIDCVKTGYSAEIEFKLKPLLGGIEASNLIEGKIKFAKETIATLNGKWDGEIILQEKRFEQKQNVLWFPSKQVIESRLKRFVVPLEEQMDFESEKLWIKVSEAIQNSDQNLATEEKTKIELKQREHDLERKSKFIEYRSKLFTYDNINKEWLYNYSDLRPWDNQTDLFQYEYEFKIVTKTKHNLKLSTRCLTSPRNSLLTLHHQTTSLNHHHRRHHQLVSNVVESNECISSNESYALLVQYNDIKQRLDQIEENLKQLVDKIDLSSSLNDQIKQGKLKSNENDYFIQDEHGSILQNENFLEKKLFTSKSILINNKKQMTKNNFDLNNFLTSTNLLIALFAWLIGLISAIFSQKLFSLVKLK